MNGEFEFKNRGLAWSVARRALIVLLGLALFAQVALFRASALEPRGEVKTNEDYRRWSQADPRWGELPLGSEGGTVSTIGCLVASAAKLIIQTGLRDSSEFNIGHLAVWLNANGGVSSGGALVWSKLAEMIDGLEFEGTDTDGDSSDSSAMQARIMSCVAAGKHVVLTVNDYGHYVLVDNARSLEEGTVYIMDSLNNTALNADVTLASRYRYVNRLCIYSGGSGSPAPLPPLSAGAAQPAQAPTPVQRDPIADCTYTMTSVRAGVKEGGAEFNSLPFAAGVNGSTRVGTAEEGSTLELAGELVNPSGEHWFEVKAASGAARYIPAERLYFISYINDLAIQAVNPPSGRLPLGRWHALKDRVISRHNIVSVTGRVVDRNANAYLEATVTPNAHGAFWIVGSPIDKRLTFGRLAEGHYAYELVAEVRAECSLTDETRSFTAALVSPFSVALEPLETHKVTFYDPIAEEVVGEQTVAHGFYAVMISAPEREGDEFIRWSMEGSRIIGDVRSTAIYSSNSADWPTVPTPDPDLPGIMGDVTGDGCVTIEDAVRIIRHAMSVIGHPFDESKADVDGDDIITAADALRTMRISLGAL